MAVVGLLVGALMAHGSAQALPSHRVGDAQTVQVSAPGQGDIPQEIPPGPPATVPALPGASVVVAGHELFRLNSFVGSFSPAERAAAVAARIEKLAKSPFLGGFEVTVQATDDGAAILCEGEILVVVSGADAQGLGASPVEVAGKWAQTITAAIRDSHTPYTLRSLSLAAGGALLATLILLLVFRVLATLVARVSARVDSWRGRYIPSLRIQEFEVVPSDRIADVLLTLLKLLKTAAVLLCLYVYVPLVLGLFPWTQSISHSILAYLATPMLAAGRGVVSFLPDLFFLIVIGFLTHYGLRGVRFFFREVEKGSVSIAGLDAHVAEPTYKIVRFLILVFAVIVAYPYFPGSGSKAFQGVSLFLGVLFSLGSSSAISNVVSGVILTYTGAFRVGDRVKIAETEGDVVGRTLLVTRVRTIKNVEITIPNGMVLGSHIVNYSSAVKQGGLILHTTVTIGYDAPWRQVHDLLTAAARRTEGILSEPAPFVLQLSLDDYYPSYQLNAYTNNPWHMARIYSDLHANIQDCFNEVGVEIMSPAYHALRDGNRVAIPESYVAPTYEAGAFRLSRLGSSRANETPSKE